MGAGDDDRMFSRQEEMPDRLGKRKIGDSEFQNANDFRIALRYGVANDHPDAVGRDVFAGKGGRN